MDEKLYQYLLLLGDNSLILGHRLSELCGHGPNLETDMALTNISLDLFGEVRNYFQYASKLKGDQADEDSIAFLRFEREYSNVILVEKPNTDFAYVICRQYLFDLFHNLLLKQLIYSKDEMISAIAQKSLKESNYHVRFSSEWMKRLGDGTVTSNQKLQEAVENLYPFVHEFFKETELEKEMKELGIGADLSLIKKEYFQKSNELFLTANVSILEVENRVARGKKGIHSEQFGYILSELQYMQRAYPNSQW